MIDKLQNLFKQKMASSGLTTATVKKLRYEVLEAKQIAALKMPPCIGFKIPYFGLDGALTDFYRIRYLESTKKGFAALTNKKELRYVQPKATLNELYMPPLLDWQKIAKDKKIPLIITEGELKAAAGCQAGFATIGLGGVWNFRSAEHNLRLLPMFEELELEDRVIVILYDSDSVTNPKVMKAENALAKELMHEGADVKIGRIAVDAPHKNGLDDVMVAYGKERVRKILDGSVAYGPCQSLFQLNEEVCYVRNPGLILRLDNLQRMAPRAFTEHAYATRIYTETQVVETKKGASTKMVEKSAAKEWMKWPHRSEVEKVTYAPGQPRVINEQLNVWPGWGVEPKEGDVSPWHGLLTWIFGGDTDAQSWFEKWCAFPIQNPGTKLYQSVVMWGIYHGTGKTIIGYTLSKIYGQNATEIKDGNLQETHNEWAENRQFVMGDEITGGDKRGVADRLKSMVTQREIRLNPKYVPSYTVPDCINYYHTSNHPDSFFLEDNDRRYFVWEVKGKPLEREFYKRYADWMNGQGPSHLFAYLLSLDLAGFDPAGTAPMTFSKSEMINSAKSDLAGWVSMLKEDPDMVLAIDGTKFGYSLWRSEDLLKIYDPNMRTRVTSNGLARELRRAGFDRVHSGMCCRSLTGHIRLWAVRNIDRYTTMKGDDIGKLYDAERGLDKKDAKEHIVKVQRK